MRITNKMKRKAKGAIIDFLSQVEYASRNDILEGALKCYGLSPTELEDNSPRSKNSVIKSYLGTAINDLVNKKDIKRQGDTYSLTKEGGIIVKEDMVEDEIYSILSEGAYTKGEILTILQKRLGTLDTESERDDYLLDNIATTALFNLLNTNEIEFIDGKYRDIAPLEETDSCVVGFLTEKEFKPKFFKRLWLMGGKFFESFCANLLEKYYSLSGKIVVYCDITGGSDDGGIDIILEIIDYLGFVEKIMCQTKCRDRAHVTEKEVREFYGAMNAMKGTRGIYATTTSFHPSAQDLIDSIDDLVGIDGDKLFELVKKTEYGIKRCNGRFAFDNEIFTR
ncbi:MAG: restriction endonuclease [Clostridia bacterium]|nr:restriction endonuclease [Clostridia bacterium]